MSQDEMSFLLGSQSGAKVSRYERGSREPGLHTLLGYEAIFAVCGKELFAGISETVEKSILGKIQELITKVKSKESGPIQDQKLAFLNAVSLRLGAEPQNEQQL